MAAGEQNKRLKITYVYGLRPGWIALCALAGVAFVISLFVEGLLLDRVLNMEQEFTEEKSDEK